MPGETNKRQPFQLVTAKTMEEALQIVADEAEERSVRLTDEMLVWEHIAEEAATRAASVARLNYEINRTGYGSIGGTAL